MGLPEYLDIGYRLGRGALLAYPDADSLFLGGGAGVVQPAVEELERRVRQTGDLQQERDDLGDAAPGRLLDPHARPRPPALVELIAPPSASRLATLGMTKGGARGARVALARLSCGEPLPR